MRHVALGLLFVLTTASAAGLASCRGGPAPSGSAGTPNGTGTTAASTGSSAAPSGSARLPPFPPGWPHAPDAGRRVGNSGMVSSDAELASRVGQQILSAGGNAMDAAIATAFALAVVYPGAGNLGGGGFLVARMGGKNHALDFRETAPAAATAAMYLGPDGKATQASRTGHRASGVPGSVAGLWEAYQKLASKKKTWAELLAPAIALAEEGVEVGPWLVHQIGRAKKRLEQHPASAALFLPAGQPPAVGSRWRNPELATVLKRIASQGPKGFYEGPTAEAIALEMKKGGGLITARDLRGYRALWRAPIELRYRGYAIASMPPPSSGGVTLAMICHIVEGFDLARLGWHTPEQLHVVFESMRRAFVARNQKLGDPDFVKMPIDELLSDRWAAAQRATIKRDRATPTLELRPEGAGASGGPHTTHFSVVDAEGNAVALTTTLNWYFGNGVTIPGGGFLMNNEMDDFAVKVGTANSYGLVQGEPNAIAPGKRMLSSMTPTIVTDAEGRVRLVTGAAGGPTIITTVFHILSNILDFGFDPAAAVNAPRFHMQDFPDQVFHEKLGLEPALRQRLEAMGYTFKERDHVADAPSIGAGPRPGPRPGSGAATPADGPLWIGAPESRRGGAGAVGW